MQKFAINIRFVSRNLLNSIEIFAKSNIIKNKQFLIFNFRFVILSNVADKNNNLQLINKQLRKTTNYIFVSTN